MKVGVAIPARNALPWIETLLTTVRAQLTCSEYGAAYRPAGAYIADDASDDGMTQFLADRPDWYTAITRLPERTGWPGATNAAVALALDDGCDAVFLAAADDFLRLDCLANCVEALGDPEMEALRDWVVPYSQQIGGENVVQASRSDAALADFAIWPPITDKALICREVWEAVGGYSTDVTVPGSWGAAEDWEFWIKVFKAGYTNYAVVTEPVYYYVMRAGQLGEARPAIHDQTVALIRAKHPDLPWKDTP